MPRASGRGKWPGALEHESTQKEKRSLTNADTRCVTRDPYTIRLSRSSNAVGDYESL
jgi:hypothetical protein